MRPSLSLSLLVLLSSCACGGEAPADAGTPGPDVALPDAPGLDAPLPDARVVEQDAPLAPDAPGESRLASGVTLEGLALFQGVRVELAAGGAVASRLNAPIVAGRAAVVRAYVSATSYPRTLRGELVVSDGGAVSAVHTASATITRASADADPSSVLAFDLPAAELTPSTRISVRLVDPAGEGAGGTHPARLPRDGTLLALGARDDGEGLHLVLVPLRWQSDGSGRLPDTSDAWLMRVRALLLALYPLEELRIEVRAPVDWSGGLTWGGSVDFGEINSMLLDLRDTDAAPAGAYYYALVAPDTDFDAYCGGSCVTGQSYVVDAPGDAEFRVGSGVGFGTEDSASTLAHEVGHEHGRYHAPCDTSGSDADYPYRGGVIGVWGYDPRSRVFHDPDDVTDFMGYCEPQWISDYTWSAMFERTVAVSALASGRRGAVLVRLDGARATLVGARPRRLPRTAVHTPYRYLDRTGLVLADGEAPTLRQSHTTEQLVVLPPAPLGASTVVLADGVRVTLTR